MLTTVRSFPSATHSYILLLPFITFYSICRMSPHGYLILSVFSLCLLRFCILFTRSSCFGFCLDSFPDSIHPYTSFATIVHRSPHTWLKRIAPAFLVTSGQDIPVRFLYHSGQFLCSEPEPICSLSTHTLDRLLTAG